MELVKNIFFNTDKLVENAIVKISYTGLLFQNGSEEVYLHYGFGLNWDNLGEIKMEKTPYIVKGIGGFYYVKTADGIVECRAKGIFRRRGVTPVDRKSVV